MSAIPERKEPYWEKISPGGKTISFYNEDCITGMKDLLDAASVDVVVTSPPYNIGIKYSTHQDKLPREDYLNWMDGLAREIKRVLKYGGSFFLNVGNIPKDQWIAWDVAQEVRKHLTLQNVIHWVKSISITKEDAGSGHNLTTDISVGHFKPIVSKRFLNDCQEYIFHFTKNGDVPLDKLAIGVPYQDKSNVTRWKSAGDDIRDRGNTWFLPYETIKKRSDRPHPATFPVKLPEMCIKLHGLRDELVVMDPFLGIGSTALAASSFGLSFIGFDIDKGYLDEAIQRISFKEHDNQENPPGK